MSSRLLVGLAAVLALGSIGLVLAAVNLRQSPAAISAASGTTAASASISTPAAPTATIGGPTVVFGSDGTPTQVDGQRVYTIDEQAQWQNVSGSFLLAAKPGVTNFGCIRRPTSPVTPEVDLVADPCGGLYLGIPTGADSHNLGSLIYAAPKNSAFDLLMGWNGQLVVVKAHTHDPEASGCAAANQAACQAGIVVESVVWPVVPSEIDGQHVYRFGDVVSILTGSSPIPTGSFLVGGPVSVFPASADPSQCANPPSVAYQQLRGYYACSAGYVIDGRPIALKSNFQGTSGEIVVAKAHMNDPLAAQCPADTNSQNSCRTAIVVDSVVWSSNPYQAAALTQSPAPTGTASPDQPPS
jgi:hypothetical protein